MVTARRAHRPVLARKLRASPRGPGIARLTSSRTFAAAMRRIWGTRPIPELRAMWQLITTNDGLRVMPQLTDDMAERRRYRERWVDALVGAAMPIRLIDGLDDPISGAHVVARYRALVPHPDVVELPGVGHDPQREAPARSSGGRAVRARGVSLASTPGVHSQRDQEGTWRVTTSPMTSPDSVVAPSCAAARVARRSPA